MKTKNKNKIKEIEKIFEQDKYSLLSKKYSISDIMDIEEKIEFLKVFEYTNTYIKNTADFFKNNNCIIVEKSGYYRIEL